MLLTQEKDFSEKIEKILELNNLLEIPQSAISRIENPLSHENLAITEKNDIAKIDQSILRINQMSTKLKITLILRTGKKNSEIIEGIIEYLERYCLCLEKLVSGKTLYPEDFCYKNVSSQALAIKNIAKLHIGRTCVTPSEFVVESLRKRINWL
ncbi:hypothetical protein QO259_05720 [Salinicola sp. JS01]|uniref:hypothetical protein n=1 Tax=Salinicola sp. JS01 TaxID=3050071 RepID=UPI00255BDB72|nr:hypothetical protein [Salinicola sp. JS01]WIX34161.1 hypothetical protein QO259_05720 [Salinicola sp. JS01]